MASSEELAKDIAELHRRSRRTLGIVFVGMLLIVAFLAAAVWHVDNLRREAERKLEDYEALLRVVQVASADPAQGESLLKQAAPLARQAATARKPPQTPLEQLEVAIYICTGSPSQNRTHAQQLQRLRSPNAGRWQRNYLSEERNAEPIYRLVRNEIRYNPAEEEAADRLQSMIREATGAEAAKVLTFFPTPNSISVFFCQGANPPPLPQQDPSAPAPAAAE